MYKMAAAGMPSGTILAFHLHKCSHLSNFVCIEFQYNKTINVTLVLSNKITTYIHEV